VTPLLRAEISDGNPERLFAPLQRYEPIWFIR